MDANGHWLSAKQTMQFTEELSNLLEAGMQLEQALRIMENRQDKSSLKLVSAYLRSEVREGVAFSAAMRRASPGFGELFCNLVAAGDQGGAPHAILKRTLEYQKLVAELKSKVVVAMPFLFRWVICIPWGSAKRDEGLRLTDRNTTKAGSAAPPDFAQMTHREIEDYLIERSMIEPGFRDRLLQEPDVLLRDLGLPVGNNVKIQVIEEEPQSFYLVIPRVLKELEEVDDSELDEVAGGVSHQGEIFQFFRGYTWQSPLVLKIHELPFPPVTIFSTLSSLPHHMAGVAKWQTQRT